jgi:hypothetical protein
MTDKQIAEALTDAQRDALNSLPRIGENNPFRDHIALLDHGLADCTIAGNDEAGKWRMTLTEKGRAIKAMINGSE